MTDPSDLLFVCRGASCRERAGSDWQAGLHGRAHCATACQGRCATGPNAVRARGAQLLTAHDLQPQPAAAPASHAA